MTGRAELIGRIAGMQREVGRALATHRELAVVNSNLTMQQLRMVISLSADGPASGHELARALGVSPATVTGIVDRLVAQGLVERREDPADRRVRRMALSEAGVQLVEMLLDSGEQRFRALLDYLDDDTLADLGRIMGELQVAVERLRADEQE